MREKFDQKASEAQKNGKIKDEENRSKDSQVSRRGFLKKIGIGALGDGAGSIVKKIQL